MMTDMGSIGERAGEIAGNIQEKAKDLGSRAADVGQEQYGKVQDQMSRLQEQGRQQADRLAEQVRSYPLSSLFAAAGIGILVGLMMRGRSEY